MSFRRYEAFSIPTNEERLEVDFWAMVSDCRAIIAGTLKPRPWAELAGLWTEYVPDTDLHRSNQTRQKCSVSAKIVWAKRPRPMNMRYARKHEAMVRKLARLIELNGKNIWDATMIARELLKGE